MAIPMERVESRILSIRGYRIGEVRRNVPVLRDMIGCS